jgi:hypothetical protein
MGSEFEPRVNRPAQKPTRALQLPERSQRWTLLTDYYAQPSTDEEEAEEHIFLKLQGQTLLSRLADSANSTSPRPPQWKDRLQQPQQIDQQPPQEKILEGYGVKKQKDEYNPVNLEIANGNLETIQDKAQTNQYAQNKAENPYENMDYGDKLIAAAKMVPELLAGDAKAAYQQLISDPGFAGQLVAVAVGFAALQALPGIGQAISAALIMSLGFAGGYYLGSFLLNAWQAKDEQGLKAAANDLNKLIQIIGLGALSKVLSSAGKIFQSLRGGSTADETAALMGVRIPGVVRSRINLANGPTRFTPLRDNGNQVSAGLTHVIRRHFGGTNTQSQFTISVDRLKTLLQSESTVSAPVSTVGRGEQTQFIRVVDTKMIIGTVRQADGGGNTTWLTVYTDRAGNLITTYPVPAP